ncbi:hypothetical protein Bsph_1051 [Lysinibacillus sphaericus C3-41]|uniref:Uncharacterized protein n=1 Tax=Lysinibacillus sphaericus (strain C3-41) TaxID=444177 RepID=B1HM91_LYSSC|nr:hypothetical protein Bsph_1051 [Lysinibacillus sphaericus C3-41]
MALNCKAFLFAHLMHLPLHGSLILSVIDYSLTCFKITSDEENSEELIVKWM